MRSKFAKLALAAVFGLTFAFTFSCSSNNDDTGSSSSSNGGGGLSSSSDVSSSSSVTGGDLSSSSGGSSSSLTGTSGIFVDDRDNKSYKWVKIDELIWFAENLNYAVEGSKCYGEGGQVEVINGHDNSSYITLSSAEIQANCTKYGRLYDWATVMDIDTKYNKEEWGESDVKHQGLCAAGWHIPSYEEWNALFRYADDESEKLKSVNEWFSPHDGSMMTNCCNETLFSALPGGRRFRETIYDALGNYGHWWISTEYSSDHVLVRYMGYYGDIGDQKVTLFPKGSLFNVRCVKD